MRKRLLTICLLIGCGSGWLATGGQGDVFRKWMDHVGSAYFHRVYGGMNDDQRQSLQVDPTLSARIMGYALSLQLKYIRRDSSEHRIWQMLEEQSRKYLVEEVKFAAQRARMNEIARKELEAKILQEFAAATVGWFDDQMAMLTLIDQSNAPSFFDMLSGSRADAPPPVPVDPTPEPVDPGLPSDALLGKWTVILTGRYDIPENTMSVVVRRADSTDPTKYEAHYLELGEYLTRRGFQPGQLAWKITFLRDRQGRLDYEIYQHDRHDTGPANQRDYFRSPVVHTLDPGKPGILLGGNRPLWQR